MKGIIKTLKQPNMSVGYIYFYVHLVTEIVCFFVLARLVGDKPILWVLPFMYDALAFVPQGLIGYFSDKFPKVNVGLIGVVLLCLGLIFSEINVNIYLAIVTLCLGNAFLHVDGAEVTLRCSNGKVSQAAIFVGGGSFGVIMGKLLGATPINYWLVVILALSMIPFILLGNMYRKETKSNACKNYNFHNTKINTGLVVFLAVFVVFVRAYMGYGIPTSWNKTVLESILLYSFMGVGKCLGGIFCDTFGMRKTAILSIGCSVPFLCFGDKIMIISLFGILLFSMTMAVTLGLLVSCLKKAPGLAFGLTTIGLFLGTAPIFFFKFTTVLSNCILICILTIICLIITTKIIKKDGEIND